MYLINTKAFFLGTDSTVYRGKIKLTKREFNKIIKDILNNKQIDKNLATGLGKFAQLSKETLKENLANGKKGLYTVGVSATTYIVNRLKNTSRYHYKQQNYIIQVI